MRSSCSTRPVLGRWIMILALTVYPIHAAASQGMPINACGVRINTPGTYELTKNIELLTPHAVTHYSCIIVGTAGVTIDLKGHTITGTGEHFGNGIEFDGWDPDQEVINSLQMITLSNGKVSKFNFGVGTVRSTQVSELTIENMTFEDNFTGGIFVHAHESIIRGNTVTTSSDKNDPNVGIWVTGGDANLIQGNSIGPGHSAGIDATHSRNNAIIVNNIMDTDPTNEDHGIRYECPGWIIGNTFGDVTHLFVRRGAHIPICKLL